MSLCIVSVCCVLLIDVTVRDDRCRNGEAGGESPRRRTVVAARRSADAAAVRSPDFVGTGGRPDGAVSTPELLGLPLPWLDAPKDPRRWGRFGGASSGSSVQKLVKESCNVESMSHSSLVCGVLDDDLRRRRVRSCCGLVAELEAVLCGDKEDVDADVWGVKHLGSW